MKSRRRKNVTSDAGARRGRKAVVLLYGIGLGVAAGVLVWSRNADGVRGGFPSALTPGCARGYNVLVITLDTTRADRLGCYGYEKAGTPNLDGVAAEGVVFLDAVTPVPMTLPSHSSIFTGLYPPNHGVRDNGKYTLGEDKVTLAEVLKENGYDTAAFISAFVLDGRYGLKQGFDVYNDAVDPREELTLEEVINERSATRVTDAALQWLRARDGGRPFFAWVHYFDPHQPYQAPEPFTSKFGEQMYDAEISYADAEVGRLFSAVHELGKKVRTLFIVVADHGESLGEHGERTHGMFVYDAVMHVPFILSCPGVFVGGHVVDDVTVATVDVFPTVLELLGIEQGADVDGLSLREACGRRERTLYMECMTPYLDNGWAPLFALRTHTAKYILAPRSEYYDLRKDRDEVKDLFANAPPEIAADRDRLAGMLETMLAEWPTPQEVADGAVSIDAESLARLHALGYAGGTTEARDASYADPKDMMPVMEKINAGRRLARLGRNEEALATIREAVAASPNSPRIQMEVARALLLLQREEEAERALREVIAVQPKTQALVLLAQILIARREYDEADALLRQAVSLDPRNGGAFIAHGDLAAANGRLREARDSYLYAHRVDPYRVGPTVKSRLEVLRKLAESLQSQQDRAPG